GETLDAIDIPRPSKELRRTRRPAQETALQGANPEVPLAILVETECAPAQIIVAAACRAACRDHAHHAVLAAEPQARRPYRALVILEESADDCTLEIGVSGQRAILPADQTTSRSNPERSVLRREQSNDLVGRERLIPRRLPGHGSHAVKAHEAEVCTEPEVSVRGLGDRIDPPPAETLADLPGAVRILTDIERRVERERARRRHEQHAA